MMFLDVVFLILICLVAVPVIVFAVEVSLALLPNRAVYATSEVCPKIAVLVPAHNEERVIQKTLSHIQEQLSSEDRLIVVADNCDDMTVDISKEFGAIVLERKDLVNKGKGFALDYGVRHLDANPPDVVVVIDADCIAGEGVIDCIAQLSFKENRPVQALDLMESNSDDPTLKQRIAVFAWRVKNYVRPLGLKALGLPCQLMGTGMAFPFKQLSDAKVGTSSIVEDMLLGIDLTAQGHAPIFCPDVRVVSYFPDAVQAESSQRKRWEHGHIGLIVDTLPSLILNSIRKRDYKLLSLALDLAIPPLTLLAVIVISSFLIASLAFVIFGVNFTFYLSVFTLCLFVFTVFMAWVMFGREILSFKDMISLPKIMLMKIPLYLRFFRKRQKKWERTERDE